MIKCWTSKEWLHVVNRMFNDLCHFDLIRFFNEFIFNMPVRVHPAFASLSPLRASMYSDIVNLRIEVGAGVLRWRP